MVSEILELDARNLLCPLPVIKTQDFANKQTAGQTFQVICTDPGALHDIPTWCRINGHTILAIQEEEKEIRITIEVGE